LVSIQQSHSHDCGDFEEWTNSAGWISFLDALQQSARDPGALRKLLRRKPAFDPGSPYELSECQQGVSAVA